MNDSANRTEGTVRAAFQGLLQHYCHQSNLTLLCEKTHYTPAKRRITPDGEVVDTFNLPYGYWEAKDTQDDLYTESVQEIRRWLPVKKYRYPIPDTCPPLSARATTTGFGYHRAEKPRSRASRLFRISGREHRRMAHRRR